MSACCALQLRGCCAPHALEGRLLEDGLKASSAFWFALTSAVENAWISRLKKLKTQAGHFLRLPYAYGESVLEGPIANALIELVEREGLEPSTPAL